MSDANTRKQVTPANVALGAGLGLALAPFTGGASLVYLACHLGCAAAYDATLKPTDDSSK